MEKIENGTENVETNVGPEFLSKTTMLLIVLFFTIVSSAYL